MSKNEDFLDKNEIFFLPASNGESRDGVERGDDFNADETARDVATEVPLVVEHTEPPIFLADFMRDARLNLSLFDGIGCCLACCRHLARRFLNHTYE